MVSFKQAFNAARKAGNRYFSWNGNDYNTMTEDEQDFGVGDSSAILKVMLGIILTLKGLLLIWFLK